MAKIVPLKLFVLLFLCFLSLSPCAWKVTPVPQKVAAVEPAEPPPSPTEVPKKEEEVSPTPFPTQSDTHPSAMPRFEKKLDPQISSASLRVDQIAKRVEKADDFSEELRDVEDLGIWALPRLEEIFKDAKENWKKRYFSAIAMGRLGGSETKKSLVRGSRDPLSVVRMASIIALKRFPDEDVIDLLNDIFQNDSAMIVRNTALTVLTELRSPRSVPVLISALSSEANFYRGRNLWIRNNIVRSLGAFRDRSAVPCLINLLNQKDRELYRDVLASLEEIVPDNGFPKPPSSDGMDKRINWWIAWWDKNKESAR